MIDHVLGRPSARFRKVQVVAVLFVWSAYLYGGDPNGPPILRRLSKLLSRRLTAWQTVVITFLWLYVARNFGKLVGLECPEPLANLYNRSYFRATWVTTALDAGFWTAMRIKPKWARDLCSMVFSVYYLFAAEQADEKVRKVRGMLTVDHLRVSWDKPLTPYLSFITAMMRPRFMRYKPRKIRISRSHASAYKEPIDAWLYFEGPLSDMKHQDKIVLDCPGGGFVAMSPRTHDDKLMCWAGKTGIPILSLDYKKAPEYPYPYALNECYDVYFALVATRGKIVGMSGATTPRIVLSGDSAGGNLAVGTMLMVLQAGDFSTGGYLDEPLPVPESLLLIYPALDVNIGNWMTDEQMALINDRRNRKTNKGILSRKSADYHKLTSTPYASDDELDMEMSQMPNRSTSYPGDESAVTVISAATSRKDSVHKAAAHIPGAPPTEEVAATAEESKPKTMKTRLAMSSMISYFNDRILTPEMMRAMIILYIGPHNRPDFSTDYLLSPLLAPEALLARFPKTYILTGERDPLVDDTVVFAGRLRHAHRARHLERQEVGAIKRSSEFNERNVVEVALIPGISHGFLQFAGVFPEGWKYIDRCAEWIQDSFHGTDYSSSNGSTPATTPTQGVQGMRPLSTWDDQERHHKRRGTDASDGENDNPLEMTRMPMSSSSSLAKKSQTSSSGDGSTQASSPRKAPVDAKTAELLQRRRRQKLASLKSEEDLLGRRMKGLAGGLMGSGENDSPPTP